MIWSLAVLAAGIVLLVWAGEHFVGGASALATALRMRPAVIGAVVLGFGTSAPELVISTSASLHGESALGVGNVVGSNVANISLGLGVAALLIPIPFTRQALRRAVPWSVITAGLFALAVMNGYLSRIEGALLAVLMVLTLIWLIRTSSDEETHAADSVSEEAPESAPEPAPATASEQGSERKTAQALSRPMVSLSRSLLGLAGVLLGAQLAVRAASDLAERWGLSGGFIGLSLVAVGTSLPELATVAAAARKGHTELIVGNLFGSNMFNSLAVGGAMGLAGAGEIGDTHLTTVGIAAMMAMVLGTYLAALAKKRVGRATGVVLLVAYAGKLALMGTA